MTESWPHDAFTAPETKGLASGASTTPPAPFPVALQHALNPLPQLFTTFPAPSFTYTAPLSCPRAQDADQHPLDHVVSADSSLEAAATETMTTPALATPPGRDRAADVWDSAQIDRLVDQMQTSASSLLQAGGFHHLMQEQLQRECGDGHTNVAASSTTGAEQRATRLLPETPAATAASVVVDRAAAGLQRLARQSTRGHTLDRPAAARDGGDGGGRRTSDGASTLPSSKATTLSSGGALPGPYFITRTHADPRPSTASVAAREDERWARSPEAHMRLRTRHPVATTTTTPVSKASVSSSQEDGTLDDVASSRERSQSNSSSTGKTARRTAAAATGKRARSDEAGVEATLTTTAATTRATKEATIQSSLEDLATSAQAVNALDNPLVDLIHSAAAPAHTADAATLYPLAALQRLVRVLPQQSQPFRPFTPAELTHFLSQLVNDAAMQRATTVPSPAPHATGVHKASKIKKETKTEPRVKREVMEAEEAEADAAAETGGTPASALMTVAVQGLCGCVCASHPTFPAEAAPEGLVDRALTALSIVMRAIARALPEAALEAQEATEASSLSKPRRATAHTTAAASSGPTHRALIAWLEVLRAYLKHLSILVCHRTVRLASDNDLVRLEDVCVQTLFLLPHRCDKAMLHTYNAYVTDSAAELLRGVWNHLEVQRSRLAESFFSRIPLSDALRVRACVGPTGARIMPLTVAVLAAAQSLPMLHDTDSIDGVLRHQQQQCQLWASLITQKLLVEHMHDAKAEVDVALAVAVQLAEDLTELLACPEWPAADPLLRVLVLGLAHTCLSGSSGLGSGEPSSSSSSAAPAMTTELGGTVTSSAVADWLRPLAVDIVAHVALKLYDSAAPFRTVHRVASSYLPPAPHAGEGLGRSSSRALDAMAANLIAEANVEDAFFSDWIRALNTPAASATTTATSTSAVAAGATAKKEKSAHAAARGRRGGRQARPAGHSDDEAGEAVHETDGEEVGQRPRTAPSQREDLSATEQLQALAYYAYNRHMEHARHTRPDVSSGWWHARAAQLTSWQQLSQTQPPGLAVSDAALRTLLLADSPSRAGLALDATQFRWWLLVLSAGLDKSMTSRKMAQTLLSLLLSVFHIKDARGHELEVCDTVVKKVLMSLSNLTALYPPLHRIMWQMARQCVQDSSARVRESMVPLLLTVLTTVLTQHSSSSSRALHGREGGLDKALALPEDVMDVVADVVSSLLHLLEDRSITVVSRTVAALETILTEPTYRPLLATPKGAVLLAFAEFKLLALVSGGAEKKHRAEVTRLFLRRWLLVLPEGEDATTFAASTTSAHAQLARELVALTTRCSPEFPHEVPSNALVVQLLGGMVEEVHAQASSARRRTKHSVSEAQLQVVMRGTVRTLWARQQAATSAEEAVGVLATLHALAQVGPEWLESLLDVLVQALDYPPPQNHAVNPSSSSVSASAPSALAGGTLLHVCAIWRTLLSSSRVPSISLDRLARAMTVLLSKYVGAYQQRIILAACGALTAMITCGATDKLSPQHVQRPYLLLCYTLMNTYYVRVRALLPSLPKEPQNAVYIQRFLFLLSEFVRLYPGWRHTDATVLTDEAVASSSGSPTSAMPNQLVKGEGICQNVYQLAQDVLAACQDHHPTRARIAVIVLRVLASVCMLDPAEYLYKCGPQLATALEAEADPALQAQGLTLIRDFLGEEDARVEMAARQTARAVGRAHGRRAAAGLHSGDVLDDGASTTAAVAAALDAHAEEEDAYAAEAEAEESEAMGGKSRARSGRHRSPRDQNSGMATWLLQRFHESVLGLCGSPHVHIRVLCLEVLEWTWQGGLLPPVKYLDALVALSADGVVSIGQRARTCLQAHADRHEEAIAAHATQGVLRAYQLHGACHLHLVRSALTRAEAAGAATTATVEVSVHGALYGLLRKRHRDTFVISLLRCFYQDSTARAWCQPGDVVEPHVAAVDTPPSELPFYTRGFVSLLGHLAVVVAFLPFSSEGDVVQVLHQCRMGVDLVGQSALDAVGSLLGHIPTTAASRTDGRAPLLGLWKAVGVVAMHAMSQALIAEYRLSSHKLQRYAHNAVSSGSGHHHAPVLCHRRPGSPAMAQFLTLISELVRAATPCATWLAAESAAPASHTIPPMPDAVLDGLRFLHRTLEAALLVTTSEELVGPLTSAAARRAGGGGGRERRGRAAEVTLARKTKAAAIPRTRKRPRDESSEDTSSDSLSEEDDDALEFDDDDDDDDEAASTATDPDADGGDDASL